MPYWSFAPMHVIEHPCTVRSTYCRQRLTNFGNDSCEIIHATIIPHLQKWSNICQIHPTSIILNQIERKLKVFDANHETNSYSPSYKELPLFLPSPHMVATNLRPLRKMLYKVHEGF